MFISVRFHQQFTVSAGLKLTPTRTSQNLIEPSRKWKVGILGRVHSFSMHSVDQVVASLTFLLCRGGKYFICAVYKDRNKCVLRCVISAYQMSPLRFCFINTNVMHSEIGSPFLLPHGNNLENANGVTLLSFSSWHCLQVQGTLCNDCDKRRVMMFLTNRQCSLQHAQCTHPSRTF